ncbi:MAG: PLP-dependent aminotransferase family protein [Rubricoccaceae bacterium]
MPPRPSPGLLTVPLDPSAPDTLHRQLYEGLRVRMVDGRLRPGQRLPASRTLAADLDVARGTVVAAYDQLLIEGYIVSRPGAGTFVADALPEDFFLSTDERTGETSPGAVSPARSSERSRAVVAASIPYDVPGSVRPLRPCLAPIDQFPRDRWAKLSAALVRELPVEALGYGDPQGYGPLREAIAEYLGAARGVRCSASQILITGGSQQALWLAAQVLLDVGNSVWVEDPGYGGVRVALATVGADAVPVPVDADGLVVNEGIRLAPNARMAVVAPAYQYPLGVTMSLSRRVELLRWAHARGGWIVEDDYDGEYRYAGDPLATLHSLDPEGRVLYIGTLSKVLAPALRMGYIVVPPGLVESFVRAKDAANGHAPTLAQATLARFIDEGDFGRHLRRMRRTAASRRDALVNALRKGGLAVDAPPAGLQLYLDRGPDASEVEGRAAVAGITVVAPAREGSAPTGLVLGFAAFREGQIRWAARELLRVLGA